MAARALAWAALLPVALAAGGSAASQSPVPTPAAFRLAKAFGDHMVLQRDASAAVWGFAPAGSAVRPSLNGAALPSVVADATGLWRVALPPQPAGGPHTLSFASSGSALNLTDVLFGDVILCSGQSNAVFAVPALINATEEIARADDPGYQRVRIMTVGDLPLESAPQRDLRSVLQPWVPVNSSTIARDGGFGEFSAFCWLAGRNAFDALNRTVPLGLLATASSGTPIQAWLSSAMLSRCPQPSNDPYRAQNAGLWNGQVAPLTVGPMPLTSILWWQGEANSALNQTDYYACVFPVLVEHWRDAFAGAARDALHFGFVHLQALDKYASPLHNDTASMAWFREAQLAALALPNVTAATAIDLGDPLSPAGSVHPRDKQRAGERLAAGLLAQRYGADVPHISPRATGATCTAQPGGGLRVDVALSADEVAAGGGLQLLEGVSCPTALGVNISECSWYGVLGSDGLWRNATAAVDGAVVTLTADAPAGITPKAGGYAWSIYPVVTLVTKAGPFGYPLPVLPWLLDC